MKKQLLLLVMMLLPMAASADDSGTCGDNLTWTYLASSHKLIITGSGNMTDYGYLYSYSPTSSRWDWYDRPWESFYADIQNIEILDGVTSIGCAAFRNCTNLRGRRIFLCGSEVTFA